MPIPDEGSSKTDEEELESEEIADDEEDQFIGADEDSDEESEDKSDAEVIAPPEPKWLVNYQSCLLSTTQVRVYQRQEVERIMMIWIIAKAKVRKVATSYQMLRHW